MELKNVITGSELRLLDKLCKKGVISQEERINIIGREVFYKDEYKFVCQKIKDMYWDIFPSERTIISMFIKEVDSIEQMEGYRLHQLPQRIMVLLLRF